MKKIPLIIFVFFCLPCVRSNAQAKYFNGKVQFLNSVKSYVNGVSENEWKDYLFTSDTGVLYSKENKLVTVNKLMSIYEDLSAKTLYKKIYNRDTLFTGEPLGDTASIRKMSSLPYAKIFLLVKSTVVPLDTMYLGYKCNKVITAYYNSIITQIVLDSLLYKNGQKIILFQKDSGAYYESIVKGIAIEEKLLKDDWFLLPPMPITVFKNSSIYEPAKFGSEADSWIEYLSDNIKSRLARKYLTIPKGEDKASATIIVRFIVDTKGKIINAIAENKEFEPIKLAEEIVRVISKSDNWNPAIIEGKPIVNIYRQPLTFVVNRD